MSEPLPAPPYRPLPKIVAKVPIEEGALAIGDFVDIEVVQANMPPFWRTYEVTMIDGDDCRLVTRNKRFAINASTSMVKQLRDMQRGLRRRNARVETKQ